MKESSTLPVFISYSHKDRRWLDDLHSMLSPLGEADSVQIWWDGKIKPSDEWRKEIENALSSARVAVLLVSRHFLASDFIAEVELPYLLEAARLHKVKILWLLVSPCLYEHTLLKDFQAVNDVARPLSSLRGAAREHALKLACQTIAEAAGTHLPSSVVVPSPAQQPWDSLVAAPAASRVPPSSPLWNQAEARIPDPWANMRTQSSNAAQGCAGIFASVIVVFSSIVLYFVLALAVMLPLSEIDGLEMKWTFAKAMNSMGWGCIMAPLYYSLFLMAFLHGVTIAYREKDNLRGAKKTVIEVAILTFLTYLLSALTYSKFSDQTLGLIGSVASLGICLLLDRWASRYLPQRGDPILPGSESGG